MSEQLSLANFDTLIWDLDGTILDSFKISLEIWTEVLRNMGRDLDPEHLRRNYHQTLRGTGQTILGPEVGESDLNLALTKFMARDNVYIQDVDRHLFKDAVDLSKQAHSLGHRQIIVTNRAHGIERGNASPRNLIANSALKDCIDLIICGDEVTERKPNVAVLGGINYNPETTLVIGDQHVDAHFANNINAIGLIVGRHPEIFEGVALPGNNFMVGSLEAVN